MGGPIPVHARVMDSADALRARTREARSGQALPAYTPPRYSGHQLRAFFPGIPLRARTRGARPSARRLFSKAQPSDLGPTVWPPGAGLSHTTGMTLNRTSWPKILHGVLHQSKSPHLCRGRARIQPGRFRANFVQHRATLRTKSPEIWLTELAPSWLPNHADGLASTDVGRLRPLRPLLRQILDRSQPGAISAEFSTGPPKPTISRSPGDRGRRASGAPMARGCKQTHSARRTPCKRRRSPHTARRLRSRS